MAIDEFMIAWHARAGRPVVRLYGWDPPAITIGRHQDFRCVDLDACRDRGIDVVRRITGGGAIFHDRELTYAIACGAATMSAMTIPESYRFLNGAIFAFYEELGLFPSYSVDDPENPPARGRPPFCFAGRERYDVMVRGKKIGGNAQRRMGGTLFQHGSIPFEIDRPALSECFSPDIVAGEYGSLNEALGVEIMAGDAADRLRRAFEECLGVECVPEDLTSGELREVDAIMTKRYRRDRWNHNGTEEDDDDAPTAALA